MRFSYICSECGQEYEITPDLMLCKSCSANQSVNEPLRGILEVKISGELTTDWEIYNLLPIEREFFPPIPVGNTPLWRPERLRSELGFPNLYIKDDTCNPTGSLKDRASFLVAAFAKKYGINEIVLASTGNAGSSMAGIGAAAGLKITLFLPQYTPEAKLVQALSYGADVKQAPGNYDLAYDLSLEHSTTYGGMSRNTGYNPMTIEGKKTAALEIFKQLKRIPDVLFVPVGDGVILSGIYKGFCDLKDLGITSTIPTIYAVQAEGSSAIHRALESGNFSSPVTAKTLADSISVDVPRGGYYALNKLQQNSGQTLLVSDTQILHAQKSLASKSGLFAEPAAAATYAGFLKIRERLPKNAHIVLLITGSGLKDINSARRGLDIPDEGDV